MANKKEMNNIWGRQFYTSRFRITSQEARLKHLKNLKAGSHPYSCCPHKPLISIQTYTYTIQVSSTYTSDFFEQIYNLQQTNIIRV